MYLYGILSSAFDYVDSIDESSQWRIDETKVLEGPLAVKLNKPIQVIITWAVSACQHVT